MKKDALSLHHEAMQQLHAQFSKKIQYHTQKAYLELKDVFWLVHEFFTTFLGKERHFTEQEMIAELKNFHHDFITLSSETLTHWQAFLEQLSQQQYTGSEPAQQELQKLVQEFSQLVEATIGAAAIPQDDFSRSIQAAKVLVQNQQNDKAEQEYKKLMHEYEHLSPEDKRSHYTQLEQLYESIVAGRSAAPKDLPR